jgi:thioredoxin 1
VDVDKGQDIAAMYDVKSMPTFLFLKDGKIVARFSGASVDKLTSTIKQLI